MTEKRTETSHLYRSQTDRMIGGVCGGFAEYFEIDSTLVRVIWLIFTVIGGIGFLAYIACLFVMKENPQQDNIAEKKPQNTSLIVGIGLILIGLSFLASNFNWGLFYFRPFHFHFFRNWFFDWDKFWPIIIIVIGVIYLYHVIKKEREQEKSPDGNQTPYPEKRLTRSLSDKMIGGVCSGLAQYLNVDPVLIRIIWIIITLVSGFWLGILSYIILLVILPEESIIVTPDQSKPKGSAKDENKTKGEKNE